MNGLSASSADSQRGYSDKLEQLRSSDASNRRIIGQLNSQVRGRNRDGEGEEGREGKTEKKEERGRKRKRKRMRGFGSWRGE